MSTDRIIVHSSIATEFLNAVKSALDNSASDDPSALPPTLVNMASKARVEALISSALSSGAEIVHGTFDGPSCKTAADESSVRMAPVILGKVKEGMRVWQDESFASLAAVMVVDSDEEAIRIANSTGYGLSAAVFTEDLRKGFALAKKLQSG